MVVSVPVLTYHSNNVNGNDYHNNDHVALQQDLALLASLGKQVISLQQAVDWHLGNSPDEVLENAVCLSFDDGSWFDYYTMQHPLWGEQAGFFEILAARRQTIPGLHATAFVIVSPAARTELDETCLAGAGWWTDEWWPEAQQSGLLSIANHSWDHNHPTLRHSVQKDNDRGSFALIADRLDCDAEIRQAQRYLNDTLQLDASLFAYPWGQASDYLRTEYFPRYQQQLGIQAAFSTSAEHLHAGSDRWFLPRFTCGVDWRSSTELLQILSG